MLLCRKGRRISAEGLLQRGREWPGEAKMRCVGVVEEKEFATCRTRATLV